MDSIDGTGLPTQPQQQTPQAPRKWSEIELESSIYSLEPQDRIGLFDQWAKQAQDYQLKAGWFDNPENFQKFKIKEIQTRRRLLSPMGDDPDPAVVQQDYKAYIDMIGEEQKRQAAKKPDQKVYQEVLDGKRNAAFVGGQMIFNPKVTRDPALYRQALAETDAPSDIKVIYAGRREDEDKRASITRRDELASKIVTPQIAERVVSAVQEGTEILGVDVGSPQDAGIRKDVNGIWSVADPYYVDWDKGIVSGVMSKVLPGAAAQYKPMKELNEFQKKYGLSDDEMKADYMEALKRSAPTSVSRWVTNADSLEDYVPVLSSKVRVLDPDIKPRIFVPNADLAFDKEAYDAVVDSAKAPEEAKTLAKESRTQIAKSLALPTYNLLLNNRDDFMPYAEKVKSKDDMVDAVSKYYKDKKDQSWYEDLNEFVGQAGGGLDTGVRRFYNLRNVIPAMFGDVEAAENAAAIERDLSDENRVREMVSSRMGMPTAFKLTRDIAAIAPDLAAQFAISMLTGGVGTSVAAASIASRTGLKYAAARAALGAAMTGAKQPALRGLVAKIPGVAAGSVDNVAAAAIDAAKQLTTKNPLKGGLGTQQLVSGATAGLASMSGTFSEVYSSLRDEGMPPEQALDKARNSAAVAAAITSAITYGFSAFGRGGAEDAATTQMRQSGQFTVRDLVSAGIPELLTTEGGRQAIKKTAVGFLRKPGDEALEEALDQFAGGLAQYVTNPSKEAQDKSMSEIIQESLYAGLLGGIVGGGIASLEQATLTAGGSTAPQIEAEMLGAGAVPPAAPPAPAPAAPTPSPAAPAAPAPAVPAPTPAPTAPPAATATASVPPTPVVTPPAAAAPSAPVPAPAAPTPTATATPSPAPVPAPAPTVQPTASPAVQNATVVAQNLAQNPDTSITAAALQQVANQTPAQPVAAPAPVTPAPTPAVPAVTETEAPSEPAPVAPKGLQGSQFESSMPKGKERVTGQYQIIEADDLITSFDPGFPKELQPRDRTRAASKEQIAEIAINLDPERLGESPTVDVGAPNVDENGAVLSGNGRVTAIRTNYQRGGSDYRNWINQNAERFGFNAADVAGMKNPVLVRKITDYGNLSKEEFAVQANQSQVLTMSKGEKAKADASILLSNTDLFSKFRPSEDGNILVATNREFISEFVKETNATDLLAADGSWTPDLGVRIQNAVLATMLGGDDIIIQNLIEDPSGYGLKKVSAALSLNAPNLVKLFGTDYSINQPITQAIKDFISVKNSGQKVEEFLDQSMLFADPERTAVSDILLTKIYNAKSQKELNDFFSAYATSAANAVEDQRSGGLFGDEPRTVQQIVSDITTNEKQPAAEQQDLTFGKPKAAPAKPAAGQRQAPEAPAPTPEVTPAKKAEAVPTASPAATTAPAAEPTIVEAPVVEKKERRLAKDQIGDLIAPKADVPDRVPASLKGKMYEIQIAGANAVIDSMEQNGAALNGDGTGVGKTRQIIAVAKHYADQGKVVFIISKNDALGKPFEGSGPPKLGGSMQKDSVDMGVNLELFGVKKDPAKAGNIYVSTYNRIKDSDIPQDAVLILDEAHELANIYGDGPGGKPQTEWAKKFRPILDKSSRVAFYTATPADKPHQFAYLHKILGFPTADDYLGEMVRNGAVIKEDRFNRSKKKYAVPKGELQRRLVNWVNGLMVKAGTEGRFIKREISYEGTSVQFQDVKGKSEQNPWSRYFSDAVNQMNQWMSQGWRISNPEAVELFSAELTKIGAAVDILEKELKSNRKAVMFFSRIKEFDVNVSKTEYMMGEANTIKEVAFRLPSPVDLVKEELKKRGIKFTELHGESDTKASEAQKQFQEGNINVMLASVESGGTGINLDDTKGTEPRSMIFMFAPWRGVSTIQAMGRTWRSTTIQNDNNPTRFLFVTTTDIPADNSRATVLSKKLQVMGAAIGGTAVSKMPLSRVEFTPENLIGLEFDENQTMSQFAEAENQKPLKPVKVIWEPTRPGSRSAYKANITEEIREWYNNGGLTRTGLDGKGLSVWLEKGMLLSNEPFLSEAFATEQDFGTPLSPPVNKPAVSDDGSPDPRKTDDLSVSSLTRQAYTPGEARKIGVTRLAAELGITSGGMEAIGEVLGRIARTGRRRHKKIASDLINVLQGTGVQIKLVSVDPMKNGWYDPATNTVFINLDGPHEMGVVETILHELVHAGTESAIRNPVTDAQKRLVESLRSQMADARKAAESLIRKKLGKDVDMSNWGRLVDRARMLNDYDFFDVVYGLSSLSEFSTHATTSKAFQQFLSTVEKGGKQMGLFDRFISAIARFFTGKADFATDVYRDIVSLIGAGDKGSVRRPNYDAAALNEYIGMPASAARGRFTIPDAVQAIRNGDTDTPIRALNETIEQSMERVKMKDATSERRARPRATGKGPILDQIVRARNSNRLPAEVASALNRFVEGLRDNALADTAVSLSAKAASNTYDFAENLVTLAIRSAESPEQMTHTAIHEFYHGLSRFIPDEELGKMKDDYIKAVKSYIKDNPWFVPFIGRRFITPQQYDDISRVLTADELKNLPVGPEIDDGNGNKLRKINFSRENYRLMRFDEWVVENLADAMTRKMERPVTMIERIARIIRDFVDLMRERLLGNPYLRVVEMMSSPADTALTALRDGPIEEMAPVMYGGPAVGDGNQFVESTARSTIENVLSLYAPALRITPEPTVTDPMFYDGVSLLTNESLMDGMDDDDIRAAAQRAAVAYNAASEDPLTSQVIQKPGFLLPSGLPDQYRRSVARGLMNAAQYASKNGIYPLAFELGTEADAFGATGMMLEQELASQARGVSAEMDAEYMAAVEAGDMVTAQRMVDEAARAAGYNVGPVYHGAPQKFVVFDSSRIGQSNGRGEGPGFYFTDSKSVAEGYARNDGLFTVMLRMKNPLDYNAKPFTRTKLRKLIKAVAIEEARSNGDEITDGFLSNFGDTYGKSIDRVVDDTASTMLEDSAIDQIGGLVGAGVSAADVLAGLRDSLGFDGFVSKGFRGQGAEDAPTIFVVGSPEQIKSADPVTRDDAGNVIPLSQRFQPESPDIRFSTARGYVRIPGEKVIIDPRRDKILSKFRGRGMLTPEAFEATLVTEQEKRAGQQAARFLANNLNKAIETAFGKGTKNTKGLRVFVIDSKGNVSFTQPFETLKKAQDFATKNGYAQYVIKSPEELINVALGNSEPSLTEKQQELLDEQEEKGITAIKNRIAIEIDKMLRTQNEYIAEAQKASAPQSRFDEIANDKKIFQETIAQLQARLEAKLKKRREKLEEWMLNRNSRNFKDTQDEARAFLPAKVVEEIVNARDAIDGRSEEIAGIEYLMGDGMMRIIFEANNGIYVTRVYEAFESANRRNYADWLYEAYMATVEGQTDEKGRPIKYNKLAAERIAPLVRVLTERLIDKRAKDIISDADQRMVDDVWSELVGRKFYKFIDQEAVKEGAKAELLRRRRRNKQLFISSLAQYLASDIDILLDADTMGRASGITPASTPKEMLRAAKKVAADVYNNPEDNLDLLDDSGIDYNRMLMYRLPTKKEATDTARQQYQMAEAARRKGIPDPSGVKWRTSINNEVYGSFISALNHDFTENLLFIVDAPGGKSGSSKSMEDWKKIGDQILMNRKNVPDYMRKFWGEIDNPANRVTQTIIKQSTLLANAAYRENIAKIGLAQGWAVEESEFKSDPAKYYGWRKLVSGDEGYEDNPLKDLYVHPEIYNSLEIRRSPNDPSNGAFKFIGGWVGVALWNATSGLLRGATRNLASLPNWALNSGVMLANPMEFARFWSNFGIAAKAISEHLSTVPKVEGGAEGDPKSIKIVKDSWAWMLQAYGFTGTGARVLGGAGSGLNAVSRFFGRLETKADSKAYQDLYTRAAREGIADNNIERNDMARLLNYEDDLTREPIRKNIDTFFPWGGVASKAQDAFGYIIKTAKATMGNRTEYYSSMDSMTKITLWLTEMESQAKIHAKDDAEFNKWRGEDGMFRELPAELQTKAAQNVNNTVQSDSRVAESVVQFRKSGWGKIMSPFLASRVEFIRTAANAYRIAFDEINNGVNSKEKARGFNRLLSAMTAHFVYASIATAFAVAVMRAVGGGEEDDEEGKTLNATELDGLRKMLPEWANNKVLAARVYKNGDIDWADVSFQLPFGWINEIFISASKGMDKAATDDLVAQTVAVQIVSDFIGNFSSRQIAIEAISNAMSGYDRIRNKEIWEKDDNLAVKIQKGVEYYFKSAGYPGDVRDAIKMYKAAYGVEENGSKYKMDAVLLSMATGQSIRTQKVSEMFLSEMRQAQDHYRVVNRSLYSSALRDANNVDPESVVEDTLLARRRFNEITRDLNQTFAAAVDVLKAGGMPHAKAKKMITDVMKSQEVKLSQTLERAIINNYIPKYRASEITEKKIRSLDKKYSDNRFNAYLDAIRK